MASRVGLRTCGMFYARSASILATQCTLSWLAEKLCHQTIHFLTRMIGLVFRYGGQYELPTMRRFTLPICVRGLLRHLLNKLAIVSDYSKYNRWINTLPCLRTKPM